MSSNDISETSPRVLFVYYSHTKQAQRVCDAMSDVLRERGWDVSQAGIEFTDPHYAKNFQEFPFRHAVFGILPLLWPQLRRKTGQIRIPDEAKAGDYDLICFGSPTWFFTTNMPLRSYLKSDEARAVLAGKPFAAYVARGAIRALPARTSPLRPHRRACSTRLRPQPRARPRGRLTEESRRLGAPSRASVRHRDTAPC
jgi:flavodoxin